MSSTSDRLPLTAGQQLVWLAQRLAPTSPAYSAAEADALNVCVVEEQGSTAQVSLSTTDWPFPVHDLSGESDPLAAADRWMAADLAEPVDMTTGPLFGHALFVLGPERHLWYHRCHHIALDGYGFFLVAQRVAQLYTAPADTGRWFGALRGVVEADHAYQRSARRELDGRFWQTRFADRPPTPSLTDRIAGPGGQMLRRSTPLPEDAATVPVGFPIANTTCHVLRPDGGRADVGERGELAVGGDGLAVGYLNDPALTAARFVPSPFGPGRLYRTGDVCSVRPDGAIEFHGRLDTQVKLHGHRIELAEVESALRAFPGITDVVVTKQGTSADARLVADVVAASDREPPGARALSGFLRDRLPRYAVPAVYRLVDRIPLTPQGKVDRPRPRGDTLLDQVRAVWLRTLLARGLTPVIEPDSTLFDVGGTSFDVLAIHGELAARFDVAELSPIDLFTYPTLRGYTAHLADLLGESSR